MNKENIMTIISVILICLFVGKCTQWEWSECRKVGHGKLYCVVKMGH